MNKYRCIIAILVSLFLFNCSKLYLSAWNCTEGDGRECDQAGNVGWLTKKALDILIVMDTSPEGQELNPLITNNLGQLLACLEPAVDWRVGIISGVEDESFPQLGQLTSLEIEGQISTQTVVHPHMENYRQVFSDTVSLKSGCAYPPYCIDGDVKPLTAVAAFMKRYLRPQRPFLREYASFAAIIISPSDEEKKQSSTSTPAQVALREVYTHYKANEFIGLAVTDSGNINDCVTSSVDYLSDGLDYIQQAGSLYAAGSAFGLFTPISPLALLGITLLPEFARGQLVADKKLMELMKFARDTNGHVFDICKPHYGRALAYSILQKMNMEDRFPKECQLLPSDGKQKFAEK